MVKGFFSFAAEKAAGGDAVGAAKLMKPLTVTGVREI
jgi:hypothetical protein